MHRTAFPLALAVALGTAACASQMATTTASPSGPASGTSVTVRTLTPRDSGSADDRAAVMAVVNRLWDAMRTKDTTLFREVFAPGTRLVGLRPRQNGDTVVQGITVDQFITANQRDAEGVWVERTFDPEIRIRGSLATVWTWYEFERSGQFSHCGVDAIQLLRTSRGWKIVGVADTYETACPGRSRP